VTTIRPREAARTRTRLAVAGVAVLLAAVSGCSSEPPQPPPDVTVTPTVDVVRATPPEPTIPLTWPLTGVAADEVTPRPAVAVKIENTSQARPQSGLQHADVVWETIVEFQVSRLVAVFHSQLPEEIGPVRSVRPMDIAIASPLRAPFVFSGGQPAILQLVYNSNLQPISHDAGADGLYRIRSRSAPHNVYASLTTILAQADADHAAPPVEQFAFALRPELASAVRAGTPATTLSFRLSSASTPNWAWDAGRGQWLRSEGSSAHMDAVTGAQVGATNVVSVVAGHPDSGYDAQNAAPIPTYELVGEGDAVVATGGMTIPARWRKAAEDQPLQLFDAAGAPILLAPGNTWVELVPAGDGSLTVG
jgi:hypothetical protein